MEVVVEVDGRVGDVDVDTDGDTDLLAQGMSRLHMSAHLSAVPRSVTFGHRGRSGASIMPGLVKKTNPK